MDEHIIAILVKEAIDKEICLRKHEMQMRINKLEDKVDKLVNENITN